MKNLIFISCVFLFCGCIFTYDPPRGVIYIHNNSDEPIYVYNEYGHSDSLPLITLLAFFDLIDVNQTIEQTVGGIRKKPYLSNEEKVTTLFFFTEETIRNYDLEEIYKNQMFVKRVVLTQEELENSNWEYSYSP
ncbi:hypothetical protein M2138_001531 [Dysgonomonadaceae bacterium PH5-43]|nr:hypothetical protein [Dysgonomonadaceae bacterium PH5-43]